MERRRPSQNLTTRPGRNDEMMRTLSKAFRSIKPLNPIKSKPLSSSPFSSKSTLSSSSSPPNSLRISSASKAKSWCVYLIISTTSPIKTYVGITTDFTRRLKQHNGELKGGAKASRAGRPWVCACIIQGFNGKSEACQFESVWKNVSKKISRQMKKDDDITEVDNPSRLLLQHRHIALRRVNDSLDCTHLEINWQVNTV